MIVDVLWSGLLIAGVSGYLGVQCRNNISTSKKIFYGILIAAFLLRVVSALILNFTELIPDKYHMDSLGYEFQAWRLARGFGIEESSEVVWNMAWMISRVFIVFGYVPFLVGVFSALIGVLTIRNIYKTTELMGGEKAAALVSGIWAVLPSVIFVTSQPLRDPIIFLVISTILVWMIRLEKGEPGSLVLATGVAFFTFSLCFFRPHQMIIVLMAIMVSPLATFGWDLQKPALSKYCIRGLGALAFTAFLVVDCHNTNGWALVQQYSDTGYAQFNALRISFANLVPVSRDVDIVAPSSSEKTFAPRVKRTARRAESPKSGPWPGKKKEFTPEVMRGGGHKSGPWPPKKKEFTPEVRRGGGHNMAASQHLIGTSEKPQPVPSNSVKEPQIFGAEVRDGVMTGYRFDDTSKQSTILAFSVVPDNNLRDFLARYPIRVLSFLLSPFPWQSKSLFLKVTVAENIFLYGLLIFGLISAPLLLRSNRGHARFFLLYLLFSVSVYSLIEGNVGTGYRHRMQFGWIFFIPGAIYLTKSLPGWGYQKTGRHLSFRSFWPLLYSDDLAEVPEYERRHCIDIVIDKFTQRNYLLGILFIFLGLQFLVMTTLQYELILTVLLLPPFVCLLVGLRNPSAGIALGMGILPLLTVEMVVSGGRSISVAKLTMTAMLLSWALNRDWGQSFKFPLLSAWIAFLAVSLISVIFGIASTGSIWAVAEIVIPLLLFVAVYELFRNKKTIRELVMVMAVSGVAVIGLWIIQKGFATFSSVNIPMLLRVGFEQKTSEYMASTLAQPNYFAAYCILVGSMMVGLGTSVTGKTRFAYYAGGAVSWFCLLWVGSMGAIIGILSAFFLSIPIIMNDMKKKALAVCVLVAFGLIIWGSVENAGRFEKFQITDGSIAPRKYALKLGLMSWYENPILGSGLGTFEDEAIRIERTSSDSIPLFRNDIKSISAHNEYLRILVEEGAVGLIAFFSLHFLLLFYVWREAMRGALISYWTFIGLVGFSVHALFDNVFSYSVFFVLFWVYGLIGMTAGGEEGRGYSLADEKNIQNTWQRNSIR
jgi:O-antigen ligase